MCVRSKQFRLENRQFELFRGRYYQSLANDELSEKGVKNDEIKDFWSTMWNKNTETKSFENYLVPFEPDNFLTPFPSKEEFINIINSFPCWKAAGVDGIYNFFIKKLTSIHAHIYEVVKKVCLEGTPQGDWFYRRLTYLIPKGIPSKGSDFRPITCMSNLYKLTTKCVTKVVELEVEKRGLLAENQIGTVKRVQGAKEQALLNVTLNKK